MTSGSFLDRNEALQLAIRDNFPNTYKMLQYNPKGTFLYLKKKEVIETSKTNQYIGIDCDGTNNLKAWEDYLKAVEKHLDGINPDPRLKQAKRRIADKIKRLHYKKYPYWPKPNTEQSCLIDITCCGGYKFLESHGNMDDSDGHGHYIAYSCEGTVTVLDRCTKPKSSLFLGVLSFFGLGGSKNKITYYSQFFGNPMIKVIVINLLALELFEKGALKAPDKIKRKIDDAFQLNAQKRLKLWGSFEDSSDDEF